MSDKLNRASAEVSEWNAPVNLSRTSELLWSRVIEMEPVSLNPNVLSIPPQSRSKASTTAFMPLEELVRTGGV